MFYVYAYFMLLCLPRFVPPTHTLIIHPPISYCQTQSLNAFNLLCRLHLTRSVKETKTLNQMRHACVLELEILNNI